MRRFTFRLHKVQRLRKMEEERAQVAFASAQAEFAEAERALSAISETRTAVLAELHAGVSGGKADPAWPVRMAEYAARLDAAAAVQERKVASARVALEAAQSAFEIRRRERKALDELETKARAQHKINERLEEQSTMDETASVRHARGMGD